MNDYEFSSAYIDSIMRGLRRTGHADAILARLGPEALALAKDPYSETWQPARLLEEIGEAAITIIGEPAFEALSYGALNERFGPIVLPMIKSSLAASNRSPGTILKKLNDLVKVAIRGIGIVFQPEGTTAGIVQIAYPRPVAAHVVRSWLGLMRFVFESTSPGEVKETYQSPEGGMVQVRVEWKAPDAPKPG
ncbi:MAG: hypothetical protein IAE78_24590 [Myxococcus sp.]|nr:hypothetical protein [Myxococcus sp.]